MSQAPCLRVAARRSVVSWLLKLVWLMLHHEQRQHFLFLVNICCLVRPWGREVSSALPGLWPSEAREKGCLRYYTRVIHFTEKKTRQQLSPRPLPLPGPASTSPSCSGTGLGQQLPTLSSLWESQRPFPLHHFLALIPLLHPPIVALLASPRLCYLQRVLAYLPFLGILLSFYLRPTYGHTIPPKLT